MAKIKKTDRLSLEFIDWYYPGLKSGGPVISLHNELIANKNVSNSIVITRNRDIDGKIYEKNKTDEFKATIQYNVFYVNNIFSVLKFVLKYKGQIEGFSTNGIYSLKFSLLPVIMALLLSKKLTIRPRGMLQPQAFVKRKQLKNLYLFILKRVVPNNSNFIASNHLESKSISKFFPNVESEIRKNAVRKFDVPLDFAVKPRDVDFVYVGRISKEKGVLKLLDYFIKNKKKLTVIGPVDNDSYSTEFLRQVSINKNITYLGSKSWPDIKELLLSTKFYISFTEGENFGQAIIEALGCGCSVILPEGKTVWDSKSTSIFTFKSNCLNLDAFKIDENSILTSRLFYESFSSAV